MRHDPYPDASLAALAVQRERFLFNRKLDEPRNKLVRKLVGAVHVVAPRDRDRQPVRPPVHVTQQFG